MTTPERASDAVEFAGEVTQRMIQEVRRDVLDIRWMALQAALTLRPVTSEQAIEEAVQFERYLRTGVADVDD